MKNSKLSVWTRVLLAVCSIAMITVLFSPIWRIELNAPQYPEGLSLTIYANGLHGNVDIINGLNHYIGMKTLHNQDFPEFTILPYCVVFFALIFLLVSIVNRKRLLHISFFLFVAFGVFAMVDFWKWEYNYGHNLDPHAAIVVPGMAYQPPLIGFKQLLNFGAYSIPDIGGWIFIGIGAIMLLCVIIEWRKASIYKKLHLPLVLLLLPILSLTSCKVAPEKINVGADNCAFCKMTISDPRFGAEILTKTGKTFKFDDIHCMNEFLRSMQYDWKNSSSFFLADFCNEHQLIEVSKSYVLKSPELKCPMDGHLAAFSSKDSLNNVMKVFHGEVTIWSEAL
ncbi:MAG: hypothetical protein WCG87_10545 [Bacteroidota bacterium]